MFSAPSSIDY